MDPDIVHYAATASHYATQTAHHLTALEDLLTHMMGEGKIVRHVPPPNDLLMFTTIKFGGVTEDGGFTHYNPDLLRVVEGFMKEYDFYSHGKNYLFWRVTPSITCIMGDGCNVKGYAIRARLLCTDTRPEGI